MNSEADRTRSLVSFFQQLLPALHRNATAKKKAGGNGHVS